MQFKDFTTVAKRSFQEWQEDKVSRLAAALAFYTVLSLPPLLILTIAIAGQVVGQQVAQDTITSQIQSAVGQQGSQFIGTVLENADQPGSGELLPSIISLVILFFGASAVFVQLQDAMNTIWDVVPDPESGISNTIVRRISSFALVLALGFLLLVSLLLSALLGLFNDSLASLFPGGDIVVRLINFVVSLAIITLLFAAMFKVIPDVEIDWSDVWIGAFVTAVLFKIGEFAIGFYLNRSNPASTYGAAGSLIVLLLWVYYSTQIVFLGAEFTQVYAKMFGTRIRPDEDAVFMTKEMRAKQGVPREEEVRAAKRESPRERR